jgi:large subunit ribosomal protein L4
VPGRAEVFSVFGMINLTVHNRLGEKVDAIKVDESVFGGKVRYDLLKQAIVMYHANRRMGTAATRSRGMVAGSTRKIFRQKGTGYARAGTIRTGKRVGGGVTFAKQVRDFGKRMPKKQRRLARDSAVLAKLLSDDVLVIDELRFEKPRTKDFVVVLENLKILNKGSCLVTTRGFDDVVYRSARNVARIDIMSVEQLNAGDICNHRRILFTKEAFLSLLGSTDAGKD